VYCSPIIGVSTLPKRRRRGWENISKAEQILKWFLCVVAVYTLWKFPDILPVFITYPPVFTKLLEGAGQWTH
jgi:hypothetical protein